MCLVSGGVYMHKDVGKQDVAAAIDDEGVPMTRSKSSDKDLLLLSSGVPLRRSAASELAITLGEDMRL